MKSKSNGINLEAIKRRTRKAMKIYDLFSKIGPEKINRIKECSITNFGKLTRPEIGEMIKHFEQMEK